MDFFDKFLEPIGKSLNILSDKFRDIFEDAEKNYFHRPLYEDEKKIMVLFGLGYLLDYAGKDGEKHEKKAHE